MSAHGDNINALELLALLLALKALLPSLTGHVVLCRLDNTTSVSYINNFGGVHSASCDSIAKEIWSLCCDNSMYLKAAYIQGLSNAAYERSRHFNDDIEYRLSDEAFRVNVITEMFGVPDIDLFASRLNNQVPRFCSWKPDPDSAFVDAFTLDWSTLGLIYAFPPFRLMGRVLRQALTQRANIIIVYPQWPGQHWYPRLKSTVTRTAALPEGCLVHPVKAQPHPLKNLHLHAGLI